MKKMQTHPRWFASTMAACGAVLLAASAHAETLLETFDNNFSFASMYAGWLAQDGLVGGATNWTITATNFGGGFTGFIDLTNRFDPRIVDASADQYVELQVTVATGPGDYCGPQLLLEDADGTLVRYSWYGLQTGVYKLVAALASGTVDGTSTGSVAGLDLTNLTGFHIQVDPGFCTTCAYTLTLMNLRTYPTPPPACHTLLSDFNSTSVDGGYGSWSPPAPSQPTNWTVTAKGFGGGYKNISPNADASGETTVELRVTVTNTVDETGVTVVIQDGDSTQETWSWYGLTNGHYVLTKSLYAGTPVPSWPGSIPGLQVTNLDWFHVQADPGVFTNNFYTVVFENLEINGFNPQILKSSFNPGSSQFNLVWNSRPGRTYGLAYVSDLTGSFSVVSNNIPSGGTSTTNTVTVPAGSKGFIKAFEQCQ